MLADIRNRLNAPTPGGTPVPDEVEELQSKLKAAERLMGEESELAKLFSRRLRRAQDARARLAIEEEEKLRAKEEWSHRNGVRPQGVVVERSAPPRGTRPDDTGCLEPVHGLVKPAYLAVYDNGRVVELSLPGMPPLKCAPRGECEGMSEDSRRRLLGELQRIDRRAQLPVMVSLTFPEELVVTASEAKAVKRAFVKRLKRKHKRLGLVWRLEAHPEMSARLGRVCPHFHMLTWGAWFDLGWVRRAWTSCIWSVLRVDECLADSAGRLIREKSVTAGTNCERIRTWAGVPYCVKMYLGKEEEYPLGKAGRVWGWDFKNRIPFARERRIELTHLQVVAIKRRVMEWMSARGISTEYGPMRIIHCDAPTEFAAALLMETSWEAEKGFAHLIPCKEAENQREDALGHAPGLEAQLKRESESINQ
jgi:hypothetical protein